jgi:hypothetical protein
MSTGPTGVAGIFGQQGIGLRGPTGLQGIQGITGPNFGVTGPTGGAGNAGVSLPITGQVISMSTYGTGVAGVATPAASDSTVVTVWQAAIPSEAKGKSGMLSTYFDMTLNYPTSGTTSILTASARDLVRHNALGTFKRCLAPISWDPIRRSWAPMLPLQ